MSIVRDILSDELVSARRAENEVWLEKTRRNFETKEKLRKALSSCKGDQVNRLHSEREAFMCGSLQLAGLLRASGAGGTEIRKVLKKGVDAFAPVVSLLPFWSSQTLSVLAKDASRYEGRSFDDYLSGVFLPPSLYTGPKYKEVTVRVRVQPLQRAMEDALKSALIAWDFEAAKALAAFYEVRPAKKGDGVNRFGLLREAILGNTTGAMAFLANVPKNYDPDFSPERREFAEGVIKRDAALIRTALVETTLKFKRAWTLKTYATPARLKRGGSLEQMIPAIRSHLLGHKWLWSDWAIAWMSLAWQQGMKEPFSEPELFSEWVPTELCCPGSTNPSRPNS